MAVIDGEQDRIDRYFPEGDLLRICARSACATCWQERGRGFPRPTRSSGCGSSSAASSTSRNVVPRRRWPTSNISRTRRLRHSQLSSTAWPPAARKDRWEAQTQTEVAEHLQSEVNRRDQLLAEKEAWWSNGSSIRDTIIDEPSAGAGVDADRSWRRLDASGRPPVRR